MSQLHVIFGTGAVGTWTARALLAQGIPVRAINRSGKRPDLMPDEVEVVAADASDPGQAMLAAEGAGVIYQALNPAYHQWHTHFPGLQAGVLAAAKAVGARYVSIENLYMYDSSTPIKEESRIQPHSKKGQLRSKLAEQVFAAHQRGEVRATALRSSDYYGPGVRGSALGEMVFGHLVAGKKAQLTGSADLPHAVAYIEDVGRAAALLGQSEAALGRAWIAPHAPAVTQREMVNIACRSLGIQPTITVITPWMMRLAGLFIPEAKASVEMMYEFTEPFLVDSSRFENTFERYPTPIRDGIAQTVNWYRSQIPAGGLRAQEANP